MVAQPPTRSLLLLAAWGAAMHCLGCGYSSSPPSAQTAAPARLHLDGPARPLAAPPTADIAQAAHSEAARILEVSGPRGAAAEPIREPAQARLAGLADRGRYDDVSHAPEDRLPTLPAEPRYTEMPQAPVAAGPEAVGTDAPHAVSGSAIMSSSAAMSGSAALPAPNANAAPAPPAAATTPDVAATPWVHDQPAFATPPATNQIDERPQPSGGLPTNGPPQINESERAARQAAMRPVADRAAEISNRGFAMAQRGMLYAARAELVASLQLIAQALDVQQRTQAHSAALAAGLAAMQEAQDFASVNGKPAGVVDVAAIAAAHRTPVLKSASAEGVSPIVAQQQYLAYAQSQLIFAGGGQPVASQTLYRLGRVQSAIGGGEQDRQALNGPQAMVYHHAALGVDARNYLAANELGVLLARYGQWQDARRLLLHSVSLQPHAEGWHNLAVVHRKLGETELARRADYERALVALRTSRGGASDSLIRWVDTRTFAAAGGTEPAWPAGATPAQPRSQTASARGSVSAGAMR